MTSKNFIAGQHAQFNTETGKVSLESAGVLSEMYMGHPKGGFTWYRLSYNVCPYPR